MNDESPLIRQWILLKTLASRKYGATVKELSQEAGVSIKTIRRDLGTFQEAHFPLQEVVGDFGCKKWHLESAKPPAELNFSWEEAAALYLGRRLLEPLMGTIFWQAAREAFRKIQASLAPVPLAYLDKFAVMFCQTMVGTHDYSKKADLIDSLMQAMEDSRAVSMTYQSLQATEDPWAEDGIIIVSRHLIARQERMGDVLTAKPWDVVVVDEGRVRRSEANGYITGQTINVNGGWYMN